MKRFSVLIVFMYLLILRSEAQGLWTQKADFGGAARTAAVGFSIGNKGYIGTGGAGNTRFNDFWEYDPETNAWTQKANVTFDGRSNATSFTLEGKGYIVGGFTTSFTKNLLEYNPATNQWNYRANFLGAGRGDGVAFNIGGGVLFGTGYAGTSGFRKDFYLYSAEPFNSWSQLAPLPGVERMDAVGFTIDGKGYVGTGDPGGNQLIDWWEYTLPDNIWTQKANFTGTPRYEATGFVIGSKGYVACGYYSGNLNDCFEYNPATNSWREVAAFPGGARRSAVGFSIGNFGYLGTGYNGTALTKDFWQYDPRDPEIAILQNNAAIADNTGSYNFGSQNLNTSTPVVFTIENSGDRELKLSSSPRVTLTGTGYTLVTDAPAAIPPGSSATFTVSFNPQTCGTLNGSISIVNDDANENPYNFNLTGIGLDNIPPNLPQLPVLRGQCLVNVIAPTTSDNCSGTITGTTSNPLSYTSQGTYTVNWSFKDAANNTTTAQQTVIVDDTISPFVVCGGNQIISLQEGQNFYTVQGVEFDPQNGGDNCSLAGVSNSFSSQASLAGVQLPPGANNIVWQVTDIGGNTASCSLTVTVNPTTSKRHLKENGISVYPNPVREKLMIELGEAESGSVTISDAGGRIIFEKQAAGMLEMIDFRELPNGIYQVKVRAGNQVFNRQIRKE
jgi:N-acetylneuraminic acid mutarotase